MRIRKIKNALEIVNNSSYVLNFAEAKNSKGKFADQVFGNEKPLHVEIGMGKGDFIIGMAQKYPDINFIGIEKYESVMVRAIEKLNDIELPNLRLIRMDAIELDKVFTREINTIYLNFSDPWPKVRHHNRRLTSEIFLNKYDKIFKGKKEIYLRTDNPDLYTYSIETLSKHKYELFDVTFDLHKKEENLITTEYEDKFVSKNMPIYSLKAIKEDV